MTPFLLRHHFNLPAAKYSTVHYLTSWPAAILEYRRKTPMSCSISHSLCNWDSHFIHRCCLSKHDTQQCQQSCHLSIGQQRLDAWKNACLNTDTHNFSFQINSLGILSSQSLTIIFSDDYGDCSSAKIFKTLQNIKSNNQVVCERENPP